MRKIAHGDVKNILEYEKVREPFRRQVIELKKSRRVEVGDRLSFLFENRQTVLFQVQEMLRAERIVDEAAVRFEIDTYNTLIPDESELSATMFIEITRQGQIKEELDLFMGIDSGRAVYLQVGPHRVYGAFEPGHSKEDKISAVHYVRFQFPPEARRAFLEPTAQVALVVEHPHYQARATFSPEVRKALAQDLTSGPP